jgi:hypothetical protein
LDIEDAMQLITPLGTLLRWAFGHGGGGLPANDGPRGHAPPQCPARDPAESGDDDLREYLAVVRAVHRQAGDELLGTRDGETKMLQLLGAPRGLARRLHRRQQQRCVTNRQDLLRVEQLADFRS